MPPVSLGRGTRGQPHWETKFVSELMKLVFNSSSVKLHAARNDRQEGLTDHGYSLQVIKRYPFSLSDLKARAGYAATGDLPVASFSPSAIAS